MSLVIATTTFYKSPEDIRARLALQTIREAQFANLLIVVVDGGSYAAFREAAQCLGAQLLDEAGRGMGASRRQAMRAAQELGGSCPIVAWMEPEKHPLVRELSVLAQEVALYEADILVPQRLPEGLTTYPEGQQYAERFGNHLFGQMTGLKVDAWFGPRIMSPRGLRPFLEYDGEHGDKWDSIFAPLIRAYADGLTVRSMPCQYRHPPEQMAAETGDPLLEYKRFQQLENLVHMIRTECERLGLPRR